MGRKGVPPGVMKTVRPSAADNADNADNQAECRLSKALQECTQVQFLMDWNRPLPRVKAVFVARPNSADTEALLEYK